MRLDVFLVESGLAETRQKAKNMIVGGVVTVDDQVVTKPAFDPEGKCVQVLRQLSPFVSRGGEKLAAALEKFGVQVKGKRCMDIGSSTGGFTDCLLQKEANFVLCVDSGSDQLHPRLRENSKIRLLENFNARNLNLQTAGFLADVIVMDVSFISQSYLYDVVSTLLAEEGCFISLIKPQFEAGRGRVGKGGLVKDKRIHLDIIEGLLTASAQKGLYCHALMVSPIRGGDGNIEYLALFRKTERPQKLALQKIITGEPT